MRSSQLGSLPRNSTGSLGILETIYGWVKDGLMALAELLQGLGNFVSEWGLRWLGALSEAYEAVREATQKVVNAMNAIVKWIIEGFTTIFNTMMTLLVDGICRWICPIISGFMDLADCYINSRKNRDEFVEWAISNNDDARKIYGTTYQTISLLVGGAIFELFQPVIVAFSSISKAIEPIQKMLDVNQIIMNIVCSILTSIATEASNQLH
jgi:hypothetical protein